jgi:hypothetical protein
MDTSAPWLIPAYNALTSPNLILGKVSKLLIVVVRLAGLEPTAHGFVKKTRKTPAPELSVALKRKGEVEK